MTASLSVTMITTMLTIQEKEVLLSSVLLDGLSSQAQNNVINAGWYLSAPTNKYLYHEGEVADISYIVLSGKVRLTQTTPAGQQVITQLVIPGFCFGLFTTLTKRPYFSSAKTVEVCSLYCWETSIIRQLMRQTPDLALNSIDLLTSRFSHLQDRFREMATEPVEQRIAHMLIRLSRVVGQRSAKGITLDLRLTRKNLAEMIGTNLYSVSRCLRQWERDSIIQSGQQRVMICDLERLTAVAEQNK